MSNQITEGSKKIFVRTQNTGKNSLDVSIVDADGNQAAFGGGLTDSELRANPVDIEVTNFPATQPVSLASVPTHAVTQSGAWSVTVSDGSGPITVDGTVTANAGSGPFPVSDNAGTLTVDAPVGTPVFVRLSDGSSAIATLPVSLASVPSHAVTNAGVFAVQSTNQANSGVDIGDVTINNASGASAVNIQDGGNTITVDGTITANLAAGTNNIGDVDIASIAAGNNNIGDVDVASLPALPTGGNVIGIVKPAFNSNHVWGTKPTYFYMIPSQVHVAAANTVHWDMFNADAALIVRVLSIRQIPNVTTAVTGVVFDWLLERTTAVGTGGTTITAWLPDTSATALDADITCRSKPTGGATQSTDLFNYSINSEETTAATIQLASQGGLELVPEMIINTNQGHGIVLRQNQGLRVVQITNSNAGNTGWIIGFTVE